jgi:hypothetical protein
MLQLLHDSVLDTLQHPKSDADHQKREITCIGLDMVCRMTVDVARWHSEEKAQIMPICCFYGLRASRKCLQERNKLVIDQVLSSDIDSLLRAEEKYYRTWVF